MTERTELEINCMTKEENYICGYNDAIDDIHEQYDLFLINAIQDNEEIEEAIDLLDNLIGMVEDNHKSDYDKAIKMGIEALKRLSNINDNERR